jgi:2,4-dienoyl-CoA reductase-like NADH-dependent reductase (Old Yellow Enzyme family)/thioredoxin reductase
MGRRQFLVAAGMTSALGLGFKKLAGLFDPGIKTGVAMASERSRTGKMEAVTNEYPHLLSPLRIRNVVLKNRILHTPSPPHFLQGPENYPSDTYRSHYTEMAKNAAIVTMVEHFGRYPKTYGPNDTNNGNARASDQIWEDIPPVRNYIERMIEDIHCEGSLVCVGKLQGGTLEEAVTKAKKWEDTGYDVVEIGERAWTGIEAVRADLDKMEAIRKETNLLIEAVILPYTPGLSRSGSFGMGPPPGEATGRRSASPSPTGPEMEEVLAMVKMIDGLADILRMKDFGGATNHPNSFSMEKDKPMMLRFSQAIKESGAKIITAPNGGFHDPVLNEGFIASGKTDMVAMATPLFADQEHVQKAHEGRSEDIVPCVKCHNCHGISRKGPWYDTCTVNPKWGLSETKKASIRPPTTIKKVAVIGGGPAGMKAAITAAERGHRVTLYEKGEALGGLMRHTDFTKWKWAYKDFKDYLVRQTYKAGIEVLLKTEVKPETIKAKEYDTVLVATGAEPIISRIPGADGKNVYNILEAFSKKKSLGKNVVIIGAGVFGTETGICLAKDGFKVTALTSEKQMIPEEAIGPHNMMNQIDIYQNHPNFSYTLEAVVTGISNGKVIYRDATTSDEKSVKADSVVIYAGLRPRMDEAMEFAGSAGQFFLLGDCTGRAGTLQKTIRSAFFTASQI